MQFGRNKIVIFSKKMSCFSESNIAVPLISAIDSTTTDSLDYYLKNAFYKSTKEKDIVETQIIPSFFTQKTAPEYVIKEKKVTTVDWLFIFVIFFCACLAILRKAISYNESWSFFPKKISSLTTNRTIFASILVIPSVLVILCGYVITLLSFVSSVWQINFTFKFFIIVTVIVLTYYIFNYVAIRFAAFLFHIKTLSRQYFEQTTIVHFVSAIILFVITFIINYIENLQWSKTLFIILIGIVYLCKCVQCFLIFKKQMQWYEIFLYFCTIEILPLCVGVKFLVNIYVLGN